MAASDNLAAPTEPWQLYREPSSSTWISEAFVRDHNNKAASPSLMTSDSFLPLFLDTFNGVTSPAVSTEEEVTAALTSAKRKAVNCGVNNNKRRKSKVTQTTFITADAANFRRMVQQVTGGKHQQFGGGCYYSSVGSSNIVKPEPQRAAGLLPSTLDTSEFLFDRQRQQKEAVVAGPTVAEGLRGFELTTTTSYSSCFPTLESWKVMQ